MVFGEISHFEQINNLQLFCVAPLIMLLFLHYKHGIEIKRTYHYEYILFSDTY